MRPYIHNLSRTRTFGIALAAMLSVHAAQGRAAELPFNPPVGSRWIIETKRDTAETRPEGSRKSQISSRAELTIEDKTADGFRITYVQRSTTAEGNDPRLPLIRSAVQALDNVPVRAITDLSGSPVRVENLDEAKAALQTAAGRLAEPFKDKPQIVAVLNQIMSGYLDVDSASAAKSYLDDLPQLAMAQNTGMEPGEVRRSSDTTNNPLGGTLKTSSTFQLTEADPAGRRRVFVGTTAYDPDSVKALIQALSQKAMASAGGKVTPAEIESIVRQMVISLDRTAVYEVEDGMTRRITDKSVTVARAMGRSLEKTETRTITVSRAP